MSFAMIVQWAIGQWRLQEDRHALQQSQRRSILPIFGSTH